MIRGLYTSASGMIMEAIRTDITANNIANTDTSGFKKELAVLKAKPEMNIYRFNDVKDIPNKKLFSTHYIGKLGTGTVVDETYTSFEQGQIVNTGNTYNLALAGNGFFTITDGDGNISYTRDGSFGRNQDGYIVTKEGNYLLGERGTIILNDGDTAINNRGEVRLDGEYVDTVAVVDFPEITGLEKMKDNLFRETELSGQPFSVECQIIQGSVEKSNVNPIKEMVNLITALRAYEANQKCIQTHDDTLGKAVNDVGRPM